MRRVTLRTRTLLADHLAVRRIQRLGLKGGRRAHRKFGNTAKLNHGKSPSMVILDARYWAEPIYPMLLFEDNQF